MKKLSARSWTHLLLPLIAFTGCIAPTESNAPSYFIDTELPHGRLQVSRVGCALTNARLLNTSTGPTGFTYHLISIVDARKETVALAQVNCPGTVPGGSTSCIIQSVQNLKPTLACTNWDGWSIRW